MVPLQSFISLNYFIRFLLSKKQDNSKMIKDFFCLFVVVIYVVAVCWLRCREYVCVRLQQQRRGKQKLEEIRCQKLKELKKTFCYFFFLQRKETGRSFLSLCVCIYTVLYSLIFFYSCNGTSINTYFGCFEI